MLTTQRGELETFCRFDNNIRLEVKYCNKSSMLYIGVCVNMFNGVGFERRGGTKRFEADF
jgi:hypothetical protein